MTRNRELLFSVTAKDCEFQATRGSGPGGQHRNKVATAIRCTHRPSGAVGYCCDSKSQHHNKRAAFGKMARTKEFQEWVRIEAARRSGELAAIERKVERSMNESNIRRRRKAKRSKAKDVQCSEPQGHGLETRRNGKEQPRIAMEWRRAAVEMRGGDTPR